MATMFVKHKISDYENWKRVYDEFSSVRMEKGVTAVSVHRDPNDPNIIIVMYQFKDMNAAREFANSEDLKSIMEKAGVSGPPDLVRRRYRTNPVLIKTDRLRSGA
jgi:quinol monooxygenase YgiN